MRLKQLSVFGLIGVLNTVVDISIFLGLHAIGLPILLANFISTSCALSLSFFLNSRYTFKSDGPKSKKQFAHFIGITLVGLWILQPIVIKALMILDHHVRYTRIAYQLSPVHLDFTVLVPKLLSVAVSLAWNYIWYSKVVFNGNSQVENP